MRHGLALISVLLLVASCKKEPQSGLPPAQDWQSGGQAPPASSAPSTSPANPHGDMANPHGDVANPHGPMGDQGSNPHANVDMSGAGPMPGKTSPKTLDKGADGRLALGPFTFEAPKDWVAKPTTSSMRAADFVLSAKPGEEAELIVYYFGEGGAGSIDDNLDRWLGQFQQPDGKKSRDVAKIEKTKFAGQDATVVSVTGRYVAAAMPGGSDMVDKQEQSMLAAIVNSPSGPYYFKLVGAKKTVDAHAAKFRTMLGSLKLKS